jgi:hypothetical protein
VPAPLLRNVSRLGLTRACALLLGVLPLGGCFFANTTAASRALHHAPKQLSRSPGVALRVAFSSRTLRRGALTSVPPPDPGVSLAGVMNPRTGAASYTATGATTPAVVFSGRRVFAVTPHASPTDARPWLSTKLDRRLQDHTLDPTAIPSSLAAYALRPAVLVDMLSGALTGSIHKAGSSSDGGVRLSRYDVRFDLEQAFDNATRVQYSQRQIDDVNKLFDVLGIKITTLQSGSVWLDAAGNPRRVVVHFRQSPVPDSLVVLTVDVTLTPTQAPVTVAAPNGNSVVTVPSLFQMLSPFKDAARTDTGRSTP